MTFANLWKRRALEEHQTYHVMFITKKLYTAMERFCDIKDPIHLKFEGDPRELTTYAVYPRPNVTICGHCVVKWHELALDHPDKLPFLWCYDESGQHTVRVIDVLANEGYRVVPRSERP